MEFCIFTYVIIKEITMKKDKRINRVPLNLNDSELELFKKKATNYSNMSAMIRAAVSQLDDTKTKGWIKSLTELSILISKFSTELSKQGGNLNQITKRANELIYIGELDKDYYENVFLPQVKVLQELTNDVKKQQSAIFKKLLKL
ncbi:bacterial mobilization protein MobC domain protein [Prevotella sp. oral taxon 306 str. F0472]|jgi:hypothetical protein|nr:bacterial mobilization protein MobC domain protein [Prevotella sp. oral taxon 306 str. F0472]